MTMMQKLLFFILLPALAPIIFPPEIFIPALPAMLGVGALLALLGFILWQGRYLSLVLMIFLQGMNVVVRTMLLFRHARPPGEPYDILFIVASLLSIALSTYILLRLDRTDVRVQMVR